MAEVEIQQVQLSTAEIDEKFEMSFGEGKKEELYHDPLGIHTQEGYSKYEEYEEAWQPVFDHIKQNHDEHGSFMELARDYKEAVGTSDKSLPTFVRSEYFITERNRTPIYDLMPRMARRRDTVKEDNISQLGDAGVIGESGTYTENDDTSVKYSYELDFIVNRKNSINDLVELAEPRRSIRDGVVDRQMDAIAKEYEKIAIQGSSVSGVSDTTGDGRGFDDWVQASNTFDSGTPAEAGRAQVREIIEALTDFDYDENDVFIFVSNKQFQNIKKDLEQNVRYNDPTEELAYGFVSIEVDGARVLRTSGLASDDDMYGVVGEAFYWHDLQRETTHPLAKVDSPQENVATDAYSQFISRSHDLVAKFVLNQA